MITYNSKNWLEILHFHKADTFRLLFPLMVGIGIYTAGICLLEKEVLHLSKNSNVANINVMHSLLGFAISMLLVFRTNTAYDRWWEGRKLWGSLVNNSRNLAMKLNSLLTQMPEERAYFASAIPHFAVALMAHLRESKTAIELDTQPHPEIPGFDTEKHLPLVVAGAISDRLIKLHQQHVLGAEHMLLINPELTSFMDICGACERIKNTPIPFSYSVFIKKFIMLYVVTMPFGFAFSLGYLSVPIVMIIFYVLASLELIAEEIEEPFGLDPNDLPMDRLCKGIDKTVHEALGQ